MRGSGSSSRLTAWLRSSASRSPRVASSWSFSCSSDAVDDCDDASDEDECDVYECSWEQHACLVDGKSGIPNCADPCLADYVCDGEVDCDDGSDEQECPTVSNSSGRRLLAKTREGRMEEQLAEAEKIRNSLPQDMRLDNSYDVSQFIDRKSVV